jgi:uncharacterized protein YecE (DUF72 family)
MSAEVRFDADQFPLVEVGSTYYAHRRRLT